MNKEILEQAITKAIAGGWQPIGEYNGLQFIASTRPSLMHFTTADDNSQFYCDIEHVIFNHDFAKALWGEEGQTLTGLRCSAQDGVIPYWQYHLQAMVIADDPIQYLGDNTTR